MNITYGAGLQHGGYGTLSVFTDDAKPNSLPIMVWHGHVESKLSYSEVMVLISQLTAWLKKADIV